MNEDNLFNDYININQKQPNQEDQSNNEMMIEKNNLFKNLMIILLFFIYMVFGSFASVIISNQHAQATEDWIDGNLDYEVNFIDNNNDLQIIGWIENTSNQYIDVVNIRVVLLDANDEEIQILYHTVRNLSPGEVANIDHSFDSISQVPIDVEIYSQIPMDPTLSNVIEVVLKLVLFGALWYFNKESYIFDAKRVKQKPKEFFGYIIAGFALYYAANIFSAVIMELLNATEGSLNEAAIESMFNANPLNLIALFLSLVVITPIVEETVFRKGLYHLFSNKFGDIAAILISGLVFGFLHVAGWGDYINIIPYAAMGLALSFMYYYSGKNLYVVIAIHMINNMIPFTIYLIDALS